MPTAVQSFYTSTGTIRDFYSYFGNNELTNNVPYVQNSEYFISSTPILISANQVNRKKYLFKLIIIFFLVI